MRCASSVRKRHHWTWERGVPILCNSVVSCNLLFGLKLRSEWKVTERKRLFVSWLLLLSECYGVCKCRRKGREWRVISVLNGIKIGLIAFIRWLAQWKQENQCFIAPDIWWFFRWFAVVKFRKVWCCILPREYVLRHPADSFVPRVLQNRKGLPVYNGPWRYHDCLWQSQDSAVPDSAAEDYYGMLATSCWDRNEGLTPVPVVPNDDSWRQGLRCAFHGGGCRRRY